MVDLPKMRFANRLISTLPAEAIAALAPLLEPVMLEVRQSIELLGKPISHVYFVETGMISVVAKSEGQRGTEVGMIGSEGVTGCSIALGDDRSALETFVQIPGRALRVPASDFISLLSQHPTLQNLMMRYARVLWIQATSTALANVNAKLS